MVKVALNTFIIVNKDITLATTWHGSFDIEQMLVNIQITP